MPKVRPGDPLPPELLTNIVSPWPFMKWGLDIVGKFPIAPPKKVFILVATDYFSKWVEAESYNQVQGRNVENFIWKNIICLFGIPKELVADNRPQFINQRFKDF